MHTRAVSTAQHDLTMATFWVNIAGARGATLIDIYIFIGGSGRGAAVLVVNLTAEVDRPALPP